ncbi:MAG TPA: histidine kinase [Bacteroidales bacterium]|nr:histidine kinase [Bacteroidales bacterium]
MNHPILINPKNIIYALIIWGVLIVSHTFVLTLFYNQQLLYSLADGIIFNLFFAVLSLGIWYPVRFINLKNTSTTDIFLNHLGTAAISIGIWYITSYSTSAYLLGDNKEYLKFLDGSAPWRFAMGLFYYIITIFIFYLYISFRNIEEKIAQEAELKGLIRETELNLLKSQINPHFLFNSLNSVSSLTITNPEKAQEMIIKLSDFLRYSINQKEKQLVSLQDELHNINLYLDIEKTRFGDKLNFEIDVPEGCRSKLLPNMILQPLIENAIKHGVYESTEPITIWVTCEEIGNSMKITIKNNFDPDSVRKKGTGMGLKNIQNRLKIIYQADFLLKVSRNDDIFSVSVSFPQNINQE